MTPYLPWAYDLAMKFSHKEIYRKAALGSWESGAFDDGLPRVPNYPEVPPYASVFIPGLLGEKAASLYLETNMDETVYEKAKDKPDLIVDEDRIEVKTSSSKNEDRFRIKKSNAARTTATHFLAANCYRIHWNRKTQKYDNVVVELVGYTEATIDLRNGWYEALSADGSWLNWVLPYAKLTAI